MGDAICCRLEVDDDVISSRNVKTIEGYNMANFEAACACSIRDSPKRLFCDGDRPEVANDIISGTDVDTFRCYACVNLRVAIFSSFR